MRCALASSRLTQAHRHVHAWVGADFLRDYQDGSDTETCAWMDIVLHRFFLSFVHAAAAVDIESIINERLSHVKIPEFVVGRTAPPPSGWFAC